MKAWQTWRHITKLDPDKAISKEAIIEIAASETDALMLSGTLDVTPENLALLYDNVRDAGLPVTVEPATPSCARFDFIDLFHRLLANAQGARRKLNKHLGVRMAEIAVFFMEPQRFHDRPDAVPFCECHVHKVEVHGDIFILAVNGDARAPGEHHVDLVFLERG